MAFPNVDTVSQVFRWGNFEYPDYDEIILNHTLKQLLWNL